MTTLPLSLVRRRFRTHGSEMLLLTAMLGLFVFYYVARVDSVGTRGPGAVWWAVSAPPRPPVYHFVAAAVLLAALPVAAARWGCGLGLAEIGLGPGDWRAGLCWLALGLPCAVLAGWIASGSPAMRSVYPLDPTVVATPASFVPHALRNILYFGAWEVLFRGVLLFGLHPSFGSSNANASQTGLSVLAHFGRPMTETFAEIPAGFVFGGIALRTRSIWYVAMIHWTVGMSMDWFILARS